MPELVLYGIRELALAIPRSTPRHRGGPLCNILDNLVICDAGVVLLVDANQGVQAQTVSNFYLAFAHNLELIAAMNKIDLPGADPERVRYVRKDQRFLLLISAFLKNISNPGSRYLHYSSWTPGLSWL